MMNNMAMPQLGNISKENMGLLKIQEYANKHNIIWRPTSVHDVGIDGQFEYAIDNFATGQLIAIQSKSGASFFPKSYQSGLSTGSWKLKLKKSEKKHFDYWKTFIIPVILIIHNPDDSQTYWIDVREYLKNYNKKPICIEIPYFNKLDSTDPKELFQNIADPNSHEEIIKINDFTKIVDVQKIDNIIELLFILKDFNNALKWMEKRVELSQDIDNGIIFRKAFILGELGKYNEAIDEYERYEKLPTITDDELFLTIYNKARCYAYKFQFLKALLEYEKIIEKFNGRSKYQENMISVLLNKCKFLEFARYSFEEIQKEYLDLIHILHANGNNNDALRVGMEYFFFLKKEKYINLIDMREDISKLFPENENNIYFYLIEHFFNMAIFDEKVDFHKATQKYKEIIEYCEYGNTDLTTPDSLLINFYMASLINISYPCSLERLRKDNNKESILSAINYYSKIINLFNFNPHENFDNDFSSFIKRYDREKHERFLSILADVLYHILYLKKYYSILWDSNTGDFDFYHKILQNIADMANQSHIDELLMKIQQW